MVNRKCLSASTFNFYYFLLWIQFFLKLFFIRFLYLISFFYYFVYALAFLYVHIPWCDFEFTTSYRIDIDAFALTICNGLCAIFVFFFLLVSIRDLTNWLELKCYSFFLVLLFVFDETVLHQQINSENKFRLSNIKSFHS